ncbi:hypothetical protein [Testudinibacter sp. TR-2022]|uniref:hypothetical protein n=1 Tax=Testudinibacter sp. TR-2022 TaxID=2585029 RepID=UPI001119A369|nr:hypothetical protein [Testudinibacter sp. TR-2022]TNH02222.1 hypothetical protein FHQ30_13175 [Pasteurellaceae bacterium Phil11]TNH23513.1 hypothetical protein FHQ29_05230 [Testudinibacter sp. TR-2022]
MDFSGYLSGVLLIHYYGLKYIIVSFFVYLLVDVISGGFKKHTINYTKQKLMEKSKKHLLELGYQQEDLKLPQEEPLSKKEGIHVFFEALGESNPNDNILNAFRFLNTGFRHEKISYGGVESEYWRFLDTGVEFEFDTKNMLKSIILFIKKQQKFQPYSDVRNLILGLRKESNSKDVEKLIVNLGFQPVDMMTYELNNKFIIFQFDANDELQFIRFYLV